MGDWPAADVVEAKRAGGGTVSVVLPARNEEATVGAIVAAIRRRWMRDVPLVDDLLVVDSGSADRTASIADEAGARVLSRAEILPWLPVEQGKGEVLWRSLFATTSEFVCFVDADLRDFDAAIIPALLGPLFADPCVSLVKAAYARPLALPGATAADKGGRVTELVARPLLQLHWPQLAEVIQPLAGEYAARRSLLETLSFPCGYGVEFAILVDTLSAKGLDAIAQVDVGKRRHSHQSDEDLGVMAAEIMHAAHRRLAGTEGKPSSVLTQFRYGDDGIRARAREIQIAERPPARSLDLLPARGGVA